MKMVKLDDVKKAITETMCQSCQESVDGAKCEYGCVDLYEILNAVDNTLASDLAD